MFQLDRLEAYPAWHSQVVGAVAQKSKMEG
jgi:hypothetical protein